MREKRLTYWKCPQCHGTGEVIEARVPPRVRKCIACDGTGNGLVDGAARDHQRQIDAIKRQQKPY